MKLLVEKCWSKFYDNTNNHFNGEMFENLVEYILAQQYGSHEWKPTQKTWDGKKDFYREYYLNNEKYYDWVECKMYKDTLSINILTPTLIMSTLYPVNEIMFFSYSPLNSNAKDILCEFAETHHKKVKIYDDEKLEKLIIDSLDVNALDNFFCYLPTSLSNHFNNVISCKEIIYLPITAEKYTAHNFQKCTIKLFEALELTAIIENLTSESHNIICTLDLEHFYQYFEGTDKKMHYMEQRTLLPGEIISINFPIRIIRYCKTLQLPPIHIYLDNIYLCDLESKCKVSLLVNTPFIGHQQELESLHDSFSRKSLSTICLYGRSGVGKTRFMREIQCRYAMKRNKTIFISSHQVNKYCLTWLRKVFSHLFVLPLVEVKNLNGKFKLSSETDVIANLLYNDHFKFASYKTLLAQILINKLSETNTMLLIDNVQDYDNDTIIFINEILNYSDVNLNKQIILSFNQDFIAPGSISFQLLERIKMLEKDDSLRNRCIEIKNFKEEYSILYIKHCLRLSYDKGSSLLDNELIINTMINLTKGNPLFLEQIMIGLCQEGIITYDNEVCLINNEIQLYAYLRSIPNDINSYLTKRIQFTYQTNPAKCKKIKQAFSILSFFEKINYSIFADIIDDDVIIDLLLTLGFFQQKNDITFYHPLIYKYFQTEKYILSKMLMKKIYIKIKEYHLINKYPAQYYICNLVCNNGTKKILKTALYELLSNHISPEYVIKYSEILLMRLAEKDYITIMDPKQLINYYTNYCYISVRNNTYPDAIKKYDIIFEEYLKRYSCFNEAGYAYGNFIINYQNTLLTLNSNNKVIELGTEFLKNINLLSFSDGEKDKICASIHNRLHVAYNRIEKHMTNKPYSNNAFENLSLALAYANSNNDLRRIIQNKIDFGNMFFCANIDLETAFTSWEDAEKIYLSNFASLKNLTEQIYLHIAIKNIIKQNYECALNNIDVICTDYTSRLPNPFFYIKANLLKVTIFIMQKQWNDAENQLMLAEKICQTYNYPKGYPICSEFHAILEETYFSNSSKACFYYKKAFKQYSNLLNTVAEQENQLTLFTYLAAKIRVLGDYLSEEQYSSSIKSQSLRKQLYYIFTYSNKEIDTFLVPFLNQKLQYWCCILNINLPIII